MSSCPRYLLTDRPSIIEFCDCSCPGIGKAQLLFQAKALDIKGIGPSMVEYLWKIGIKTLSDLLTLTEQDLTCTYRRLKKVTHD